MRTQLKVTTYVCWIRPTYAEMSLPSSVSVTTRLHIHKLLLDTILGTDSHWKTIVFLSSICHEDQVRAVILSLI